MLPSRSFTVVVVCIATTCSYIFEEVHVRLQRRVWHKLNGYAVPYGVDSMQNYKLAFKVALNLIRSEPWLF